ncbi:MAG: ABC transporter permease subunit, partial [Thermodesulfobacteriota bacterium]
MRLVPSASRGTINKALLYLIITLGSVPILVPLFWLVGSSLKTRDRVFLSPPEWLPHVEEYWIETEYGKVKANVIDKAEGVNTGVWRLRIDPGEEDPPLLWPSGLITKTEAVKSYAPIAGIQEQVEIVDIDESSGMARVKVIGKYREVEIDPATVRAVITKKKVIEACKVAIEVEPIAEEFQEDMLKVQVVAPSDVFEIATRKIEGFYSGKPKIELFSTMVPVGIIRSTVESGVSRVRILPSEQVIVVPRTAVKDLQQTNFFATIDGREVAVKWIKRSRPGKRGLVDLLGKPRILNVPYSSIRKQREIHYRATILGQKVEVKFTTHKAPAGMSAIRELDPLGVDAELVTAKKYLAPQWGNYLAALKEEPFHLYLFNSLFITVSSIVGQVLSCSLVGFAFARLRFRGRDLLFIILLSAMMLPAQITMIPTFVLFVKLGWLDTFKPLIVPAFLAHSAFFVFLFRQFFMTFPLDLEDAARIDGCGPLGIYWHIMLPLAKPAVATVAVFTFLATWNDFLRPLLYLNSDEHQTLALALQ